MNVYVFEYVAQLTENYHSGGGLVIVAPNVLRANTMIEQHNRRKYQDWGDDDDDFHFIELSEDEWRSVVVYPLSDNSIGERMFLFPDAGCC